MYHKVLLLFLLGIIAGVLSSPLNAVSMTVGSSLVTSATSFATSAAITTAITTTTGPVISEDCEQYFAPSDHGDCFGRNCGPQNFYAGETPTHCIVEGITHDKRRNLCTWVDDFLHCPKHTKMITRIRAHKDGAVSTTTSSIVTHTGNHGTVSADPTQDCRLVGGDMRCGEQLSEYLAKYAGKETHGFDTTTTVTPTIVPGAATTLVNGPEDPNKRHILCGRVHGKVLCGSAYEAAHRKHVAEAVRVAAAQNSLIDVIRNANDYTTTTVTVHPAATLTDDHTVHASGTLEQRGNNCGRHHGQILCGLEWYNLKHEWRLESLSNAIFNATHLKETVTETPSIDSVSETAVIYDITTTITVAPTPEATHIQMDLEKRRNMCRVYHGKLLCGEQLANALVVGHQHNGTANVLDIKQHTTSHICTKHHKTSVVSVEGNMETTTTITQSIAATTEAPELATRKDSLHLNLEEFNQLADVVRDAQDHAKHNGIARVTGSKHHSTTCTKHQKTAATTKDGSVETTTTVFEFVGATSVPQELEKRRDWCRTIDGEMHCGKRLVKVLANIHDPTRHNMTGNTRCTKHHGNQTSVYTHEAAAISTAAVEGHHDDKFPHHCRVVAGKVHCEKHVIPTITDYYYTTTTTTVSSHTTHVKTAAAAMEHIEKDIVEDLLAHHHQGRSIISVAPDVADTDADVADNDDDTAAEADFDVASPIASKIEPRQFPHALPGGVPQPGFDFLQLKRDAYVRGHEKHGSIEPRAKGTLSPRTAQVLEETAENSMASITGSNTLIGDEDIAGPETEYTSGP